MWNQIKNALMQIAINHPQINAFGTGSPIDIGTHNTINLRTITRERLQYPLLFIDVQNVNVDNEEMIAFTFNMFISDKVESGKIVNDIVTGAVNAWMNSEDEVLNDTLFIGLDIISALRNEPTYNWEFLESSNGQRFVESGEDITGGWNFTITLNVPYPNVIGGLSPSDTCPSIPLPPPILPEP
jgi:hypothetical protein